MPKPLLSLRRAPAILLLGLLALLLWGQCGSAIYPRSDNQRLTTLHGEVTRTDSLRAAPPATLYLTLYFQNLTDQPIVVQEVSGALRYQGRAFPFQLPLAARQYIKQAVAISVPLPADSLLALRHALQAVHYQANAPHLDWQATFAYARSPTEHGTGSTSTHIPPLSKLSK